MSGETVVLQVDDASRGLRLDRFLSERLPDVTRSALGRWIRDGRVLVDGRPAAKPGLALDAGATIEVAPPDLSAARDVYHRLMRADHEAGLQAAVAQYGSEALHRATEAFYDGVPVVDLPAYIRDLSERSAIRRQWLNMFRDVDGLLMPVSLQPPALQDFDVADNAAAALRANDPMKVVNFLGLPAAAVPNPFRNSWFSMRGTRFTMSR